MKHKAWFLLNQRKEKKDNQVNSYPKIKKKRRIRVSLLRLPQKPQLVSTLSLISIDLKLRPSSNFDEGNLEEGGGVN